MKNVAKLMKASAWKESCEERANNNGRPLRRAATLDPNKKRYKRKGRNNNRLGE